MEYHYDIVSNSCADVTSVRENKKSLIKTSDGHALHTSALVAKLNQTERHHKEKMDFMNSKLEFMKRKHQEEMEVKKEHNIALLNLTNKLDEVKQVLLLMPTVTLTGPETQMSMTNFNSIKNISSAGILFDSLSEINPLQETEANRKFNSDSKSNLE